MNEIFIHTNRSKLSDEDLEWVLTLGMENVNVKNKLIHVYAKPFEVGYDYAYIFGQDDEWVIDVDSNLGTYLFIETLFHELVHIRHEGKDLPHWKKELEANEESAWMLARFGEVIRQVLHGSS